MARAANDFDGIIIGAGHHGLILGTYLARAGLRVAIVERRMMYGGGLNTEERTLPGFLHNLHSVNHFSVTTSPWYRDLGLDARVDYITPEHEFAQPHEDGTGLVFSRDLETTLASIGRLSPADAKTFREWNFKAEEMTRRIFLNERYSEPLSETARADILGRSALGREFLELTRLAPLDAVNDLFGDERVRVLFLFKLSLFGTVLKETFNSGSPVGSLIRAFDLSTGYQLCAGGSWNLARGLMESFVAAGGTYINQAHVEKIHVSDNHVTGISLLDGRELVARRFVSSTLDPHQTFHDLVGDENLPADYVTKVDGFEHTPWTLFGLHLALKAPPDYTAARYDANMNHALKYNIGSETLESLLTAHDEVAAKRMPSRTQFGGGALSQLDPRQAPPGRHTAYAWHVVPFAPDGDPEKLHAIRDEMADRILSVWQKYAPNMTRDNVLGSYVYTAHEYSKELINMRDGDILVGALTANQVMYNHFGYRTPVDGLYMSGSATHPNGAITGGGGYISAGIIAKDLGIQPWWTPIDGETELNRLASDSIEPG